jgi:hypothetical protein
MLLAVCRPTVARELDDPVDHPPWKFHRVTMQRQHGADANPDPLPLVMKQVVGDQLEPD